MTITAEVPTMFHYLLEMHKDGKILLHLELNVPISAFPVARSNALLALEAILLAYGEAQGCRKTQIIETAAVLGNQP